MSIERLLAAVALAALSIAAPASAQTLEATPAPNSSPTPAANDSAHPETGGFDPSKLTPEQQQALQLAIIKTSQNPVGNITVAPFQNNFNYGVGPYTRYGYNLNVQPVIPIMLGQHWNLIARTIFPIISQPSFNPPSLCGMAAACNSVWGIGDTQEQLFFAPKTQPGSLIWGAGPILSFPTGSPQAVVGTGKWGIGPDVVALVMPGNWVLGFLSTQLWSVTGATNRPNYSNFLVQPFVNYNLKDGWAISTAPSLTANWTATTNRWAIPVGGGVAKTFKSGSQLMSVSVSYYTYVARPLSIQQTQLRVVWSLLWPVKRGINIQQLLQESK